MTLARREEQHQERLRKLRELLDTNANPSEVAQVLSAHYFCLARECMAGTTPTPHLRDYWWKFHRAYDALVAKFTKLEQ